MRAGLLVSGVLGAGTALVFAAAALTATMFPNGTVVRTQWNGGWGECFDCGGWGVPAPMPAMPAPFPMPGGGFVEGDVSVDEDIFVVGGGVRALPGDIVVAEDEAAPAP